jgi:2-methylcitrate dehydratase PrpD
VSTQLERAPITRKLAEFIAGFRPAALPLAVVDYTKLLIFDGIGTLAAATHPAVTASAGIGTFALSQGGPEVATLVGQGTKVGVVNAVLANGTLGYACDFEPHHPEAILHPIAVMIPTALALCEMQGRDGRDFVTAVALGCEITCRVSLAMDPKQLYALGFHPSAVCGVFGAAAAASYLLGLDAAATVRALGLAALQASGLMAWQDDPREDARPFQMGMAARNGVTAALLAEGGFGAPDRIFDGGHDVLRAFSREATREPLLDGLGDRWDGVMELAIKPYPCVSFLHPALDALAGLIEESRSMPADIAAIQLRFAASGCHCVDRNPLKGHSAQYILPVRAARGRLRYTDLFEDLRTTDPEVARLAAACSVVPDVGELEARFPDLYIGDVTLTLDDGSIRTRRGEIARGYPEAPLADWEIKDKFDEIVGEVADPARRRAIADAASTIYEAPHVGVLAELLAQPAMASARRAARPSLTIGASAPLMQ